MRRQCSRNLHQTIVASLVSSGSITCTETIEPEEASIFGIAVRPPNGSIRRRGEPRSRSDMVRSRKFHFTILLSLSRMWMQKRPAPPENCRVGLAPVATLFVGYDRHKCRPRCEVIE